MLGNLEHKKKKISRQTALFLVFGIFSIYFGATNSDKKVTWEDGEIGVSSAILNLENAIADLQGQKKNLKSRLSTAVRSGFYPSIDECTKFFEEAAMTYGINFKIEFTGSGNKELKKKGRSCPFIEKASQMELKITSSDGVVGAEIVERAINKFPILIKGWNTALKQSKDGESFRDNTTYTFNLLFIYS